MSCLKSQPSHEFKGYDYPEPLRTCIAAFERHWLATTTNKKTPRDYSVSLWRFFSRLPSRKSPDNIYITDVEDYKVVRLAEGMAWNTVGKEVGHLRSFFRFCVEELGVQMSNPALLMAFRRRPIDSVPGLRVEARTEDDRPTLDVSPRTP